MIKIQLTAGLKKEIEKIFMADARSKAGIFTVLADPDVRKLLSSNKQYIALYKFLYDKDGKIKEDKVSSLLLANRIEMEDYIKCFGKYGAKESEELQTRVFQYADFSKRMVGAEIFHKMNISVCPYCNRQYIFTVKGDVVKSQLDHFFPKSKYPYLAVSLYNMIPCCNICNQSKGRLDTMKEPLLYPFDEEMGEDAKFEVKVNRGGNFVGVLQGISDEFTIEINDEKANFDKREIIHRQVERLHLKELYNAHQDYVRDIFKSHYINTPSRIIDLMKRYPKILTSYEETKNLLYMTDIRSELWGKRPLAKLTHDIDEQLTKGR